jgi:DNA transformation protein and related proteins
MVWNAAFFVHAFVCVGCYLERLYNAILLSAENSMTALCDLRNIGDVVAAELEKAGITDGETLKKIGSINAALRLREAGFDVCRSKLSGLEGAIRGIRWHMISKEEREALWKRFVASC